MSELTYQMIYKTVKTEESVKQLPIMQAILLHLLPGVLINAGFIFLGPWLQANHLPPLLALLIPIAFILIPFEMGLLIYLGFKRNGKPSLEGIVLNREPITRKDFLIYTPIILLWAILIFMSMTRIDQAIMSEWFGWLPDWFQTIQFKPDDYSQPILNGTFLLMLIVNGLMGPFVEELYFRGFLLPRIEYLKGWAPLVNVSLFSLYHFFSPWQFITRILAFYPMAYVVHRKRNIYLSMLAHCLLNIGYCFLSIALFIK